MKVSSKLVHMMAELANIRERLPHAALYMTCGRKNILGGYLPQIVRFDLA